MAGPVSQYLKNKVHTPAIFSGTFMLSDLMSIEQYILNPPKTAKARAEFNMLKRSRRTHYRELVKELQIKE